jgi:hypothetical protein
MRSIEDGNQQQIKTPSAGIDQPAVQAELKKQGKAKKPDENLVSHVFPER